MGVAGKSARGFFPVVGVLVAGILLSVLTFVVLRRLEYRNAEASFDEVAQERLDAVKTSVTLTLNSLVSLSAFYDASDSISRREFSQFSAVLEKEIKGIQALEWIPRVPKDLRAGYEKAARRDGFPSFQFTERLQQGQMTRAGKRPEYFPVFFVEPLGGNELALGFDLASNPARDEALELAASAGRMTATSRVILVQETADQYGFLVFYPVYRRNLDPGRADYRRKELRGFVLGVFRVGDMVARAGLISSAPSGLHVAIFDRNARRGEQLIYPKSDRFGTSEQLPEGFRKTRFIPVAGRVWEVAAYPLPGTFLPVRLSSWLVLACGPLLTFLLAGYLHQVYKRRLALEEHQERLEELVKLRTAALETKENQLRLLLESTAESEEKYRSLVSNIPDVAWTVDEGLHFTFVSPNIEKVSGYTLDEVAQQGTTLFFSSIHPEDLQDVRKSLEVFFSQNEPYDVEYRIRRKNGEWIWVHDRAVATYVRNGLRYADGLLSDITARKQVEAQLLASHQEVEAIIDRVQCGIFVIDAETHTILKANPAACEMVGRPREQIVGRVCHQFVCPAQAGACPMLDRGQCINNSERVLLTATGEPIAILKTVVRTQLNGKECLLESFVNIAMQKHQEEQLADSKRGLEQRVAERTLELREQIVAKDQAHAELQDAQKRLIEVSRLSGMAEVATGVLHNVGNVLNSINVGANLLMDRVRTSRVGRLQELGQMLLEHQTSIGDFLTRDPRGVRILPYLAKLSEHLLQERDEISKELNALVQHVGHVKEIVAMQQSYARSSGVLEKVPAELLIEDALGMTQASIERNGIVLTRDIEPVPNLVTDRHKVLQILLNLLRNAKDAANAREESPRAIAVRLRLGESERVRFQVADNGMGIAPENLARIFSHGFTTKKHGHGFGLHSGALAARQLGGSLTVESEGLGRGATFTLELPLCTEPADREEGV